jgi:ADP-ribose pyrophosphatase YjhB (NUDIX family)
MLYSARMSDATRPPPAFRRLVPAGDDRERQVCDVCGFVVYENPRIVVGSVVRGGAPSVHGDAPGDGDASGGRGRILLCRRAIEPRRGFWTLPAGYLELHETPEEGAMREAVEEAMARISLKSLLAVYTIRRLSQVQLFYRATLAEPTIAPGPESLEVGLFAWDEIPWGELAFPSVGWALRHDAAAEQGQITPFSNPPGEQGDILRPSPDSAV